jgi:hypothetical protein
MIKSSATFLKAEDEENLDKHRYLSILSKFVDVYTMALRNTFDIIII